LWPSDDNDEKVLLILSDAIPYMIKTGKTLNVFFLNMIHVTYLAHMLQRIAEKVRELFPNVNTLVNNLKKVFLKAPHRVEVYKDVLPNVALPPEPILIWWGTWIEASTFCAYNLVAGQFTAFNSPGVQFTAVQFIAAKIYRNIIYTYILYT
jgi:hypothetical protein